MGRPPAASDPVPASFTRFHPATVVLLAGVSAALHVGKLPPALPALQQALGVTLVQSGFLLSMVQFAGMTLGLLVGLSADALGLRRTLLAGLMLLTTASTLGAICSSYGSLLILRALEGLGFLLAVMPAPALIRSCVAPQQLSARLGWWGSYMPLGSALALLTGPWLLAGFAWPVWWLLLAGMTAIATGLVWWQVPSDPSPQTPPPNPAPPPPATGLWMRLVLTLTHRGPWLVALSFAVYSAQWLAVIGFMPTLMVQMGLSAALTGVLSATVALINVVGNVLSGHLLQRGMLAHRVLVLGFVSMALGAFGAFAPWGLEQYPVLRYASVLLFSALGGLIPGTLFSLAVRLAPDAGTVSTTVGFMQQWSATGQFVGPPLIAWVAAQTGGWQWTWLVTACLCLAGVTLALVIHVPRGRPLRG
ncbi:MAG: MFS transporter [Rhodoferax sp.]|uniref:MFS transporter n=1 Tax=Rhodoferax sp. TaxID=50421 RepID=UPI001B62DBB2|nr:MFS transporter [Rhodoferax sp.]MBP9684398.1 MFS transporter [Rhodoferax sp.]MBP9906521.1 MFS transporter [Rhodoferax sp.]